MASVTSEPRVSVEDYLEFERQSERKSEYHDGEIVAMAGAGWSHILIVSQFLTVIGVQLKGKHCKILANELRVTSNPRRFYLYPDLVGVCGEPQFVPNQFDTLVNPTLVIEVLSPSTEQYDRGRKFANYRQIETLREYILVGQDQMAVEQFVRDGDRWTLPTFRQPDQILRLASIGCEVKLSDIYDGVPRIS